MFEGLWTLENGIALVTLAGLEIVLGIDNIVFVVVVTNKLPEASRATARRLGIGLAMVTRIVLLLAISAIMGLTAPAVLPVRARGLGPGRGPACGRAVPPGQGHP